MEEQCYFCEEKNGKHLKGCYLIVMEKDEFKYPNGWNRGQWLKWVACEAMKGLISTQMFTQASIIENAYEMADAFLKEGEKDE